MQFVKSRHKRMMLFKKTVNKPRYLSLKMQCLFCMKCRAKASVNSVRVNIMLLSHRGNTKHNILTVISSSSWECCEGN